MKELENLTSHDLKELRSMFLKQLPRRGYTPLHAEPMLDRLDKLILERTIDEKMMVLVQQYKEEKGL